MKIKTSALFVVSVCALLLLSGCGENSLPSSSLQSGGYSLPSPSPETQSDDSFPIGKIYPMVDEEIGTNIVYSDVTSEEISEDDISAITLYTDQLHQLLLNNASEDYDTSDLPFVNYRNDTQEAVRKVAESGDRTVLNSSQILNLTFTSATTAESLECVTACGSYRDLQGNVLIVKQSSWEKVNGKWYLYGTDTLYTLNADEYRIERDTVNGKINLVEVP